MYMSPFYHPGVKPNQNHQTDFFVCLFVSFLFWIMKGTLLQCLTRKLNMHFLVQCAQVIHSQLLKKDFLIP